jgi:hypothetical protein
METFAARLWQHERILYCNSATSWQTLCPNSVPLPDGFQVFPSRLRFSVDVVAAPGVWFADVVQTLQSTLLPAPQPNQRHRLAAGNLGTGGSMRFGFCH